MSMPQPNDGLKGLAQAEPRRGAGIMPNAQHQTFRGFMTGAPYQLAIVEFDDQGRCYDRGQMDAVAQRLDALAPENALQGQDVILVTFVHGWKHDARSDDDNLSNFRLLLNRILDHEKRTTAPGAEARPVLGVFVGLARSLGVRLGRRYRQCDLLGTAGCRTAGGGRIGA
jgi:hypothetical protein